jgi:propanediol dehydratase large subunit
VVGNAHQSSMMVCQRINRHIITALLVSCVVGRVGTILQTSEEVELDAAAQGLVVTAR